MDSKKYTQLWTLGGGVRSGRLCLHKTTKLDLRPHGLDHQATGTPCGLVV